MFDDPTNPDNEHNPAELYCSSHLGNAILGELSKRGKRYSDLSYAEHQELKASITIADLQEFFAKNMRSIDCKGKSVPQIVDSIECFWAQRSTAEIKKAVWHGLFVSEIGIVILIIASPFLLLRVVWLWCRSFSKDPSSQMHADKVKT